MAPCEVHEHNQLILNVKEGFGFGYLKNVLLRVSPILENKRLISDYVYPVPQPVFNFSFVWSAPGSHLKNLQTSRSTIRIEIWATKSQQNWKVGYAVLGVQHAQFVMQDESLFYRRLPLRNAKTKFGAAPPEVFVTLGIQNGSHFNVDGKIYMTSLINLSELSARPVSGNIGMMGNITTRRTRTVRKPKLDKPLLKASGVHSSPNLPVKQKQLREDNRKEPVATSLKLNKVRVVSDEQHVKSDAKFTETPGNLEENRSKTSIPFHQYLLELHFDSIHWYTTLKNIKISIRFCNPADNNMVTAVDNEDLNLLQLFLSYVICRMYYICIPDNLLKTIMYNPPQILILKANTNRVIAMGAVKIKHLQIDPKLEQFQSYIPLITKNKEIVGKISVIITFQDLGIISTFSNVCTTECFEKDNQHHKDSDGFENDIVNDLKSLFKIHDRLKITYSKIQVGFQKITQRQVTEHILNRKQFKQINPDDEIDKLVSNMDMEITKNVSGELKENIRAKESSVQQLTKIDNYIMVIDADSPRDEKQECKCASVQQNITTSGQSSIADINKRVSFCVVPKQHDFEQEDNEVRSKSFKGILKETVNTKRRASATASIKNSDVTHPYCCNTPRRTHPANVKHFCRGCSQDLEIIFNENVWQSDELTFWCKDCKIRKFQSELTHVIQDSSSIISNLKDQIDILESKTRELTADSISRDKYNYLTAAQHNLTMSLIYAKSENEQLEIKYSKAANELEALKEDMSVPEMKNYTKTQELKREINEYRDYNDLAIKILGNQEKQVETSETRQKNEEIEFTSRRNRCEACKILRKKRTEVLPNKQKPYKSANNLQCSNENKKTSHQLKEPSVNIDEIREKMDRIQTKLQMYLEKRDELIRVNRYTCGNSLVIYMTHTIKHLLTVWFNFKIELELLVNN